MQTASVETAMAAVTEPPRTTPHNTVETHSPYLLDLYGLMDEIEIQFPEVVRILRKRIADLDEFLAKAENPYIQHGAIAATHEVIEAIHRVIQRIAGGARSP